MLTKNMSKNKKTCQVTFELPANVHAGIARLCGDFNERDKNSHPMERREDGSFTIGGDDSVVETCCDPEESKYHKSQRTRRT